jgi:hypothetical protein
MGTNANTARFKLGKTLMTRGAQGALEEAGQSPHEFLRALVQSFRSTQNLVCIFQVLLQPIVAA